MSVLGPVTVATLVRTMVGLALSVVAIRALDPASAVEMFQLLLLQSALVAGTSGAAYPRAVAIGEDQARGASFVYSFCTLFLLAFLVGIAAFCLTPSAVWDSRIGSDVVSQLCLVFGAFCAGLNSILQGLNQSRIGIRRTFLPGALAQSLCIPIIIVMQADSVREVAWIVFLSQTLPLVSYLIFNNKEIFPIIQSGSFKLYEILKNFVDALLFGWVNILYLISLFIFREYWSNRVDAVVASYVFFAMRLSDVYLQIAYFVLSSDVRLRGWLAKVANGGVRSSAIFLSLITLVSIAAAAAASQIILVELPAWAWLGATFLVAQIICDIPRTISSAVTIGAIRFDGPGGYAAIVVIALGITALALSLAAPSDPDSMYQIQALYAWSVIFVWLLIQTIRKK